MKGQTILSSLLSQARIRQHSFNKLKITDLDPEFINVRITDLDPELDK